MTTVSMGQIIAYLLNLRRLRVCALLLQSRTNFLRRLFVFRSFVRSLRSPSVDSEGPLRGGLSVGRSVVGDTCQCNRRARAHERFLRLIAIQLRFRVLLLNLFL